MGGLGELDEPRSPIEAIAEVDLAGTQSEEAVLRMLDVVRRVLGVDTAVVLLTDPSGTQLEAFAAQGLEEEVRQGYRMPVGGGFAGRIAATRGPAVLDEVHATAVLNPLLLRKGLRSMSGVPLIVGDRLIGVLHVGALQHARLLRRRSGDLADDGRTHRPRDLHRTDHHRPIDCMDPAAQPAPGPVARRRRHGVRQPVRPRRRGPVGGDWFDAFYFPTTASAS